MSGVRESVGGEATAEGILFLPTLPLHHADYKIVKTGQRRLLKTPEHARKHRWDPCEKAHYEINC